MMTTNMQKIGSFTLTQTEDLAAPWHFFDIGWWWAGTRNNFHAFGAGFHDGWKTWS